MFGGSRQNAVLRGPAAIPPPPAADASGNFPLMGIGAETSESLYQFVDLLVQGLHTSAAFCSLRAKSTNEGHNYL